MYTAPVRKLRHRVRSGWQAVLAAPTNHLYRRRSNRLPHAIGLQDQPRAHAPGVRQHSFCLPSFFERLRLLEKRPIKTESGRTCSRQASQSCCCPSRCTSSMYGPQLRRQRLIRGQSRSCLLHSPQRSSPQNRHRLYQWSLRKSWHSGTFPARQSR